MSIPELADIASLVEDDLREVERLLRERMKSVAPVIPAVGDHSFGSGGKRIRPLVVLLSARMCGYRGPRASLVSSAAEMLHTATLMHDDVVDGALTRRGRESVNARFGDRIAILVGDFLLARASQTLLEDGNPDLMWAFTNTIRVMSEGEVLQITRSFDPEIPESVYMEIIGRKTSSLLASAAEAGAILGGVTRAERNAVREYGWQVGLAFQLVDDALDYVGTREELGKLPLADLREGKVTLPLLVALRRCTTSEREMVHASLKQFAKLAASGERDPDPADTSRIRDFVERYGGIDATYDRAHACETQAVAEIAAFEDGDAKRALQGLAEFIVARKT